MMSRYQIYTEKDIRALMKGNDRLICSNFKHLDYSLVFTPCWSVLSGLSFHTAHLQFYAQSGGWKRYTETGYKSHFMSDDQSINLSDDDVIDLFTDFLSDAHFDFNDGLQLDFFEGY